MPMKFRDMEKLLLKDGWVLEDVCGSHHQYKHPVKPGKVTVPNHPATSPSALK